MNFDSVFPYLFMAVFALVAGSFLIKFIKHGGFKGAMFGAQVARTVGEVSGTGAKPMTTLIKVHALTGGGTGKDIGIEFVAKSFASYQMTPATLSVAETKKLIALLESAVRGR
jgi:hypothetical protein